MFGTVYVDTEKETKDYIESKPTIKVWMVNIFGSSKTYRSSFIFLSEEDAKKYVIEEFIKNQYARYLSNLQEVGRALVFSMARNNDSIKYRLRSTFLVTDLERYFGVYI